MAIQEILADSSVSVTELKKNPMAAIEAGNGFPVVVLNHNKPAFYCVPAQAYEILMDKLEDQELNEIADSRQGQKIIKVTLDEL
jgi:antitoxin StbD